jgi:K+-sensing histidine kinase KdpD
MDEEGDEVAIRVLDEGPGIARGEVEQLFNLFYRSPATAASAAGAGIGLFVSRRLVDELGGRMWARNRPEGGSEFGFSLARFPADEDDDEPDWADHQAADRSSDDGPGRGPAPVATGREATTS